MIGTGGGQTPILICTQSSTALVLSAFTGTVAETGTIAGIASALAMALIGAVSSYISYQQKKFCFSIQRKWIKDLALSGASREREEQQKPVRCFSQPPLGSHRRQ